MFRYQITALKYQLQEYWFKVNHFLHKNWIKIAVIVFALYLAWSKDIQFSIGLSAARTDTSISTSPKSQADKTATPYDVNLVNEVEKGHSDPSIPQPANTFSNLGFVLNPSYAKKHKVATRIVNYHNNKCKNYIQKYAPLAKREMEMYGIPASIKLAQGLLESNAGDSRLAKNNNNHFGIKCFSKKCRKGHCSNFSDDTHKDFFRKYKSVRESFRAHSQFLQKNRYQSLLSLDPLDYKGWAHGLKAAGYATDKQYATKLIRIIETLQLYHYDKGN